MNERYEHSRTLQQLTVYTQHQVLYVLRSQAHIVLFSDLLRTVLQRSRIEVCPKRARKGVFGANQSRYRETTKHWPVLSNLSIHRLLLLLGLRLLGLSRRGWLCGPVGLGRLNRSRLSLRLRGRPRAGLGLRDLDVRSCLRRGWPCRTPSRCPAVVVVVATVTTAGSAVVVGRPVAHECASQFGSLDRLLASTVVRAVGRRGILR